MKQRPRRFTACESRARALLRETLDAFRQWRGERPGTAGGAAEERRRTA